MNRRTTKPEDLVFRLNPHRKTACLRADIGAHLFIEIESPRGGDWLCTLASSATGQETTIAEGFCSGPSIRVVLLGLLRAADEHDGDDGEDAEEAQDRR